MQIILFNICAPIISLVISVTIIVFLVRQRKTERELARYSLIIAVVLFALYYSSELIFELFSSISMRVWVDRIQTTTILLCGLCMAQFVILSIRYSSVDSLRELMSKFRTEPDIFFIFYGTVSLIGIFFTWIVKEEVSIKDEQFLNEFPIWYVITLAAIVILFLTFISVRISEYIKLEKPVITVRRRLLMVLVGFDGLAISLFFSALASQIDTNLYYIDFLIMALFLFLVAYALKKPTFFAEFLRPVAEANLKTALVYNLEPRRSYIVKEKKPIESFEIFTDAVKHGVQGLCISRTYPARIKQKYNLEKTPVLWFSTRAQENAIGVHDLGILTDTINRFIEKSKNSVVLLEGLEFLIVNNGFNKVLKTIDYINDSVMQHNSRLIMPVDPETLDTRELALLERNMEVIEAEAKRKTNNGTN